MTFIKERAHNSLSDLPPIGEIDSKPVLKQAIRSNKALASLKNICNSLPNQNILLDALTLLEAKDSSEIENIFTTHDKLFHAALFGYRKADHATKEVSRYKHAMWHGVCKLSEHGIMSTNLFTELAQIINNDNRDIRDLPGTKIANAQQEVIYTPPEGESLIRAKLANLEKFIHEEDDTDPLIKLAIIHYQFEAIHPFFDGNGRVGRIINILYLLQQKLLDTPVLFLSRYFIKNKKGYYNGLKNVTEKGDWESWIMYTLEAIEHTANHTVEKIQSIKQLMEKFINVIRNNQPKIYSKDLVEALFIQPYCRIASIVEASIVKRQTASEYLRKIEALGLIEKVKTDREATYSNPELLAILRKELSAF